MVERPSARDAGDLGPAVEDRPWSQQASLVAGAAAAGFALAVGELVSGLVTPLPSPLLVVADGVVAVSPPYLTDWAIGGLGAHSTTVLQIGVVVVLGLAGAALGSLARGQPRAATVAVLALAAVVPAVSLASGREAVAALAVAGVVALAGVPALHLLVGRARLLDQAGSVDRPGGQQAPGFARRRFLQSALAVGAGAVVAGAGGRWLAERGAVEEARGAVALPAPPDPLAPPPGGASLEIAGVTPLYTPNGEFYVVDTTVRTPRVDPAGWRLAITGLVDRPLSLDYDDLLALATDEADVLLSCVSNEVGGGLAGVARWQGIRLDDLLDRAGLQSSAEQVMGLSVDGFSAGFPVEVLDGRDAIVAVGMNGEPLPVEHGFPARLVVPGLYGYVSATKWLEEIRLTTWDVDGYWVPRGWAKEGPVKVASRIDRPRPDTVDPGIVTLAGVAWAPMAGVADVEVRVDDGPWQQTQLAESIGPASWRQWSLDWQAPPGEHRIAVRAVDGAGAVQTAEETDPRPDGATGHHSITVRVRS